MTQTTWQEKEAITQELQAAGLTDYQWQVAKLNISNGWGRETVLQAVRNARG